MIKMIVEIDVAAFNLAINEYVKDIFSACQAASEMICDVVVRSNKHEVDTWVHEPAFKIDPPITSTLTIEQKARCTDLIWQWVNAGTKAIDIVGPLMVFPFQGRGASYISKTDNHTGGGISSRSLRSGKPYKTRMVQNRSIRARNMSDTVFNRCLSSGAIDSILRGMF